MTPCLASRCCSCSVVRPLQEKPDVAIKRQLRKLVSTHFGLPVAEKHLLFLFLFLFSHCIDLTLCGQVSPSAVTGLGKAISPSTTANGKDTNLSGRGGTTGPDDSESSSLQHLHHYHHRHHRHGTSGKNLPRSSSSSSSSSAPSSIYPSTSAFGYQEYSPLSYYNADPHYEPRYYERPSREFSARSTSYPAMAAAAASSSQVGFVDGEYGGLALATGHGGGHTGHGHGSGYHTTYHKTVNKLDQSSLGLLGLLGLLSLLSNVLMLLTTTASMSSMDMMMMMPAAPLRVKRDTMVLLDVKDASPNTQLSMMERLSRLILPSLNVVGHAKDGRIPLNCTYQEVCKTNKILMEVIGADDGRPIAAVMSTAITKLLANRGRQTKNNNHEGRNINGSTGTPLLFVEKLLSEASLAGRNGKDCEIAYPTCPALRGSLEADYSSNRINKLEDNRLPFLISPERAFAIIMGQN